MEKLFTLPVCVLLSATLYAGEPFATYSFSSASIASLEINTIASDITLTGDAGDKTVVQVFISGNNQTEEQIKQMLDEYYTIDIRVAEGKLFAVVKHKKDIYEQPELNISFNISVPKHVSGKMNSASGNIRISGTFSDLRFNTGSGSLGIDLVSGKIFGNTGSGNIMLTNSADNIMLNTGSGNIQVNNCTDKVSLNTGSGNIQANNCDGNVMLNSGSGNVTADNINGTLKAGSGSGSIVVKDISGNLYINSASSANVSAIMKSVNECVIITSDNKNNNIRNVNLTLPSNSGYNMNVKAENLEMSGMIDFRGEMDKKTLNGTVGNGGAKIEISKSQQVNLTFN